MNVHDIIHYRPNFSTTENVFDENCYPRDIISTSSYVMRCAILYHLYNLKNMRSTHGGVFFTFFKLHKWWQIAQCITYIIYVTSTSPEYLTKLCILLDTVSIIISTFPFLTATLVSLIHKYVLNPIARHENLLKLFAWRNWTLYCIWGLQCV